MRVIGRSLRIGLMLGLLGGLALVLAKVFGSRSGPDTSLGSLRPEPWPRLNTDPTMPSVPATAAEGRRLVPDAAAPPAPRLEHPEEREEEKASPPVWVEPNGSSCPTSHPVKAKLRSKIFHLPGMANYERTQPDRCYADAEHAEADGLRASKR